MHLSFWFAMFSWEDEIISTIKTRYFQVKCNLRWNNPDILMGKLKKVKLYSQQARKNRELCQCEQFTLNNKVHICWRYKNSFTTKSTYWKMFCSTKSVMHCTAIFLWQKSLKIHVKTFCITRFAGQQPATL